MIFSGLVMLKFQIWTICSLVLLGFITAGVLWSWHLAGQALPRQARADTLIVVKAEHRLYLMQGNNVLKVYAVALGSGGNGPKLWRGDRKVPEGTYRIVGRNAESHFHKALHVSYPTPSDRASARQRQRDPGDNIMIHGPPNGLGWLGQFHKMLDWTAGCVAVTDQEIDEIWRAVPNGTRVIIRA